VRVGFICTFSGGSQNFGNSARLGAELAVKEINEVGGYLGRRIELVARDDKADPDEGRKIAEELVLKEKVDFTVGFCNTGVALKSLWRRRCQGRRKVPRRQAPVAGLHGALRPRRQVARARNA
jgi:branched-chain amino acid transport system substrate-binding protein